MVYTFLGSISLRGYVCCWMRLVGRRNAKKVAKRAHKIVKPQFVLKKTYRCMRFFLSPLQELSHRECRR
mgnify:CR=1 FL=1